MYVNKMEENWHEVNTLRIMKSEHIQYLIEEMTREIITYIMDDFHCDMTRAMEMYYNSDTFQRVLLPSTGLYYQSSGYVYSFLKNELLTGKVA